MLIKTVSGTVSNEASEKLSRRLRAETRGEVLFSAGARGRYATDASIYQVMPVGDPVVPGPGFQVPGPHSS